MTNIENPYREETEKKILKAECTNYMLELPTGFGKTKIALDLLGKLCTNGKVLIVVPTLSLIEGWKEEIKKWDSRQEFEFTTYRSLDSHTENTWNAVVFDECHHLSERCCDIVGLNLVADHFILMSATVPREVKKRIKTVMQFKSFKVSTKKATANSVLATPMVIEVGMTLNNKDKTEAFVIHKNGKNCRTIDIEELFKAYKEKNTRFNVLCTQKEYYDYLTKKITYYKNMFIARHNAFMKNRWVFTCGIRLKWLSNLKTGYIKEIMHSGSLENKRTLTFCSTIKQSKEISPFSINSKDEESTKYLNDFNEGRLMHITACKSLNEGVNLKDCHVGIFAAISSSDTMTVQRIGRILRVNDPIIIVPFFVGTRDEEIMKDMQVNFRNHVYSDSNKFLDYLNKGGKLEYDNKDKS